MQLNDVMTRKFEYIGQGESVRHAAQMMRDHDIGMLPVLEENQVIGTVTDRDIVTRGIAEAIDPDAPVSQIMTTGVQFRYLDDDVEEAAKLMEQEQIRRLVVLDRSDRCVGIVSLGDIATRTGETRLGGEVLEGVWQPSH